MNNRKGFTRIALIVAILTGILVFGGGGYFGMKQYRNYQVEKMEREKKALEREKEEQMTTETQQEALKAAQQEIEKLKIESEQSKTQQKVIEQKLNQQNTKPKEKDLSITSYELAPYLSGVVEIECKDGRGSGSLWNLSGFGFTVLTNKHVVSNPYDSGNCIVYAKNPEKLSDNIGIYDISTNDTWRWNNKTDVSLMGLKWKEIKFCDENWLNCIDSSREKFKPIKSLNYSISTLIKCSTKMPIGAPVVVVGFPAFAGQSFQVENHGTGNVNLLTTSNGIISAQDDTVAPPFGDLLYPNYFVSAKVDSGNSGGIALSKTQQGLCVLGIPTWVSVGNYETNGVIQNIHNVMYRQ